MPAVTSASDTGNAGVNGITTGIKYDKAVETEMTFSFPATVDCYSYSATTENFGEFSSGLKTAARKVMAEIAQAIDWPTTEVTEVSGSPDEAITRYGRATKANNNNVTTAFCPDPSSASSGYGSDVWFSYAAGFANVSPGGYGWLTVFHETGHAFGLKHAHQVIGGPFQAMSSSIDALQNTVMSYRSYLGRDPTSGYTNNSASGYPQTLMRYDILALQYLYGERHDGDDDVVVHFNPTTGEISFDGVGRGAPAANKLFCCIYANSTVASWVYDFSDYTTNGTISLVPGEASLVSSTQLADLGDGFNPGFNVQNAFLAPDASTASVIKRVNLGSGNDTVTLYASVDQIVDTSAGGNKDIDGNGGTGHTVICAGDRADWNVSGDSASATIQKTGAQTITTADVQYAQFDDQTIDLDDYTPDEPLPPSFIGTVPIVVVST